MISLLALLTGLILDCILGDPLWLPHPVRFIGRLIAGGEKLIRRFRLKTPAGELMGGMVLALAVCAVSFAVPFMILRLAYGFHPVLGFVLEALMCYQILALKSLKQESMKVYERLKEKDLAGARKALSFIVGRDTENLDESQVTRGAVETVAENLSDGVIAPLLFMLVGGAPLGFLYKGINTLDSMIGYKNERYLYFGRFAARLDDIANFLPARISACLMLAATLISGLDFRNGLKIYRRDRYNHSSPNSAHTEAVCAGALRVQLGGSNYYFGKLVPKPTIGDDLRPLEAEDIRRANQLLYITAILGVLLGAAVKMLILRIGL